MNQENTAPVEESAAAPMGSEGPPAGRYLARMIPGTFQTGASQNKGTAQCAIDIEAWQDEKDFVSHPTEPMVTATVIMYLTEKAFDGTVDRLRVVGWTDDATFARPEFDGEGERTFPVTLKYEEYEGELKPRWQIGSGGGTFKMTNQLAPDAASNLDALLRDRVKAKRMMAPTSAKAPPAGAKKAIAKL